MTHRTKCVPWTIPAELAYEVTYRFDSSETDTTYTMIAQLEAKGVLCRLLPITLRVFKKPVAALLLEPQNLSGNTRGLTMKTRPSTL